MHEKNKFSCEEHIDIAIDDFLVDYETFPILTNIDNSTNKSCNYCAKNALYELKTNL
ncbi:CxxH/CxxC protein [Clostridium rectalis]|uniref:CxxH/CxxC protein n=1 Tax=Clostridium rectalis TaxID=2040295 RepID=UPI000F641F85|nr:CxxH/CxxC protein [Clostridium rectalis]